MAEAVFDIRSLASYGSRGIARKVLGRHYTRDVQATLEDYTEFRSRHLSMWKECKPPIEVYLISEPNDERGRHHRQIIDGELVTGAMYEERTRLLDRVVRSVLRYSPRIVVEFGCGIGRNLIAIKRRCPSVRCLGLELVAPAVELANMASEYYGFPIEVSTADITKPLALERADVCFSVQALEEIPDSVGVFEQMRISSLKGVVLFEPMTELYPYSIRGFAARLRMKHLDRLAGLYSYIGRCGYPVKSAELLGDAGNALNPIAEVNVGV
jgi:SAM-dependent methyltransferase